MRQDVLNVMAGTSAFILGLLVSSQISVNRAQDKKIDHLTKQVQELKLAAHRHN